MHVWPAGVLGDAREVAVLYSGTSVTSNLTSNTRAPNGTASITSFTLPGSVTPLAPGSTPVNVTDPSSGKLAGALAVLPNGTFVFAAEANFTGKFDVPYTVASSDGQSVNSTLTIDVWPPLTDGDETRTTPYETPVSLNLLDNAVPTPGTTTSILTFTLPGDATVYTPGSTAVAVVDPASNQTTGTIVILASGNVTFTPATGFSGTVPTVSYVVQSSYFQQDNSTLMITVTPGLGGGMGHALHTHSHKS
jgi:hypothetical protein